MINRHDTIVYDIILYCNTLMLMMILMMINKNMTSFTRLNKSHKNNRNARIHIYFHKQMNSSSPSAAYMRHWIGSPSATIMACHLLGAKPHLNQCWVIVIWTLTNKRQWNSDKKIIRENASEKIVCQMAAILFRGRWVKKGSLTTRFSVLILSVLNCTEGA